MLRSIFLHGEHKITKQNTQTSYSVVGDHEENNKQTIIPQRQKAILQINKRNKKTRNNIIYSINAVLDLL